MTKDEEISYLNQLLATPAWDEFLVKHLQKWKENDINHLTVVRDKGASPPDDFLRGRIDVYNFLLTGLRQQLQTWLEEKEPSVEDEDSPPVGDPYGDPGPTPGER